MSALTWPAYFICGLLVLLTLHLMLGPAPRRRNPRETEERKNKRIMREIERWRDGR